jgi:hypothetical protein
LVVRNIKVSGEIYSCFLESILKLLNHLDVAHGVHIWYERGMTKKRVFFDGVLEADLTEEKGKKDTWAPVSRNAIPLSKRPYEPRKSDEEEERDF